MTKFEGITSGKIRSLEELKKMKKRGMTVATKGERYALIPEHYLEKYEKEGWKEVEG